MRIELIYKPGCGSYKRVLSTLETAIAEEFLPISIEIIETFRTKVSPTIRIDGQDISSLETEAQGEYCRIYDNSKGASSVPSMDFIRKLIWSKWQELTKSPLPNH